MKQVMILTHLLAISLSMCAGVLIGEQAPEEAPVPIYRFGDKVVFAKGFYAGQPARISERCRVDNEFKYKLLGDGAAPISGDWYTSDYFHFRDLKNEQIMPPR